MKSIQTYHEAHADIMWEKTADGNKFVSQKTRNYVVPELSDKTWFEFSQDGAPTVAVRAKVLSAFVKRFGDIIKGEGKTTFAKSDLAQAKKDLVKLKAISIAA